VNPEEQQEKEIGGPLATDHASSLRILTNIPEEFT